MSKRSSSPSANSRVATTVPLRIRAVGKMVGLTQAQTQQIRAGEATGNTKRDALVHLVRTLAGTRGTLDKRNWMPCARPTTPTRKSPKHCSQ